MSSISLHVQRPRNDFPNDSATNTSTISSTTIIPNSITTSLPTMPIISLSTFSPGLAVDASTTASVTIATNSRPQTLLVQGLPISTRQPTSTSALTLLSHFEPRAGLLCPGQGLDSAATGILSVVIFPSAIGLVLILIFAILRPRFRQVYALREWFVQSDLRPKPLEPSFLAFLFPNVPLIPPIPSDISNAGRSVVQDAKLFPSDEELSQRALWVALLIALGWTFLGLGGALPLYLVTTPCNADLQTPSIYGGGYSTLTDLSLIRLLRLFENVNVTTEDLSILKSRSILSSVSDPYHARIRIIVLTVLVIFFGLLPALIKILNEFTKIVEYRQRWLEVKCEGKDLGWLSAKKAPGFATWGEKQFKDYLLKIGLSSTFGESAKRNGGTRFRNAEKRIRHRGEEQPLNQCEYSTAEVDIQSLFSIGDTHRVALLIDERDEILENLEISETNYISSFRVTTPDPSIIDFVPPPPPSDPRRPYISRPLPLTSQPRKPRARRHTNRAYGSSSLAPTSFVAPSSYYKLRGVQGISGGRFADPGLDRHQSLTESINSRVIGSRFMEVNRNSAAYGQLPLGSHVALEKSGELGPVSRASSWLPPIPDPRLYGPNYYEQSFVDEHGLIEPIAENEEWVELSSEEKFTEFTSLDQPGPSNFAPRPRIVKPDTPPSTTRRETFPRRLEQSSDPEAVSPPHLRLQPSQPFVRPLDGLGFEDLGHVYEEITQWRSKLKIINAEITEAQSQSYNDIASGTNINGWLMVGRGLRFIPGVEIIEGRAKEDIRWDVLQNERSWLDTTLMCAVITTTTVAVAAALTAAVGLSLASAPDVAHYIPFLQPVVTTNTIASGVASVFAPALAATLFIVLGLAAIKWVATIHGSISVSGNQLLTFKITFFMLCSVGTLWIISVGAILFSIQVLNTNKSVTKSIASGAVYMGVLCLALIINVAFIFPAILLLQPLRLWRVLRAEKQSVTPRQRFRAVYPRTYDPSFAIATCILAIVFASTFSLIFPLIAPAVVLLLFLTLIAHRFLIGYVYARTHSQTGGLLQIWLLRRFASILSFQPILLGLILLAHRLWIEGSVLAGTGVFVIAFVESYASWKTRISGCKSLSAITRNSLETFAHGAHHYLNPEADTVNGSSKFEGYARGSMASVLEMMSITLAVTPSSSAYKGSVPLQTENLDDLTATERAARTHPDAPPHLPLLPFTDHAEDMAGIMYAPELIAPPPIIWLPNDYAGVARSEAVDLQKYHDLQVTLDVRANEDVMARISSSSRRRSR